jgi:hypothetical protein
MGMGSTTRGEATVRSHVLEIDEAVNSGVAPTTDRVYTIVMRTTKQWFVVVGVAALLLLVAACTGASAGPDDSGSGDGNGDGKSVSGEAAPVTSVYGSDTQQSDGYVEFVVEYEGSQGLVDESIANSPIATDGSFSVDPLPDLSTAAPSVLSDLVEVTMNTNNVPTGFTISSPGVQAASVTQISVYDASDNHLGTMALIAMDTSGALYGVTWLYVDGDATVSGTGVIDGTTFEVDLILEDGWNRVITKQIGGSSTVQFYSGPEPVGATWTFIPS